MSERPEQQRGGHRTPPGGWARRRPLHPEQGRLAAEDSAPPVMTWILIGLVVVFAVAAVIILS